MIWKEKYKIGIQVIDEQHEELFRRVSDFIQSLQQEGRWEEKLPKVKETMDFMQSYVVLHFDYEEAYQQKVNYPEHEEHHKIHEDFKQEINKYAQQFEQEGYQKEVVQKLAGKLMTWLINHVAATDLLLAKYVKSQEADPS